MRLRSVVLAAAVFATLPWLAPDSAFAAWSTDPASSGSPVGDALNTAAFLTRVAPDGSGGAITCWVDARGVASTPGFQLYVQRTTSAGDAIWGANGLLVRSGAVRMKAFPACAGDGGGGAFIAWFDSLTGGVRVQHFNASGVPQWGAVGLAAHGDAATGGAPVLLPDGAGGIYVAFLHRTPAGASTIRIQRMTSGGAPMFGVNGITLAGSLNVVFAGLNRPIELLTDGAGGSIVVWQNAQTYRVSAQRVNASGVSQWIAGGVSVTGPRFAPYQASVSDGAGGAIVAFMDDELGAIPGRYHVRAQRLSAAGAALWAAGGIALSAPDSNFELPSIVTDGAGGAFVGVPDPDAGLVRVQRVSPSGVPLWPSGGAVLGSSTDVEMDLVADGRGGVVGCWDDTSFVTRTQGIDASGTIAWSPLGVPVFQRPYLYIGQLVNSPGLGTIVVTAPTPTGPPASDNGSVFAKFVREDGRLGDPAAMFLSVRDVPADQGGWVYVTWTASALESSPTAPVAQYRLWRRNDALPSHPFEVISTTPARGFAGYGSTVATSADSSAAGIPYNVFQVEAVSFAGSVFSAADSGYSVDNLPPFPPTPLPSLIGSFGAWLHWLPSEGASAYRLYRGADASFVPGAANLVATISDTAYVDANGAGATFKVVAVDLHGNVSAAVTLSTSGTAGVGDNRDPLELALAAPSPNPLRSGQSTALRFTLPVAGPVTLALHDIAGRQVRVLALGPHAAGVYTISLVAGDARDGALPAGLYFARLTAQGRTLVRRLVVTP